jgi:predicted RNase H-like HicB family nuclease
MSDGETREEAARNVEDAIRCWIEEAIDTGRQVPTPTKTLVIAR